MPRGARSTQRHDRAKRDQNRAQAREHARAFQRLAISAQTLQREAAGEPPASHLGNPYPIDVIITASVLESLGPTDVNELLAPLSYESQVATGDNNPHQPNKPLISESEPVEHIDERKGPETSLTRPFGPKASTNSRDPQVSADCEVDVRIAM